MKNASILIITIIALISSGYNNSSAEIQSEDILKILLDKGIITEADIDKAEIVKSKQKPRKIIEKAEEETDRVKAARHPNSADFKGRIQLRFTALQNGNLSNVTSQNSFDKSEFEGFVIRRVRLCWYGEVIEKLKYHIQVSVDGDHNSDKIDPATPDYSLSKDEVGVKLQDAYFTYKAHPLLNITAGQFKARISPSYLTSGPVLPFCERALAVDKLSRKREIGISLESPKNGQFDGRGHNAKVNDKPLYYAIGVYNGNGLNKNRNDNDNFMASIMFVGRPNKYFNFGASYAYDHIGYDSETSSLGTATIFQPDPADPDTIFYVFDVKDGVVGKPLNIWDFNTAVDIGPLHVQAEYLLQLEEDVNQARGYSIQAQYDLTDKIQITGKYEEYDPDIDADNTFDSRWYTVGINGALRGQKIKGQLNYTFRNEIYGEEEDNDSLIAHFQVLF